MLNFAPHPLAPLLRGAGSFAAKGLNKKPINYQLSALRCGQRSLACTGFVGTHRSGHRKNRIGINVDAPLKCLPLAELEGKVSPLVTDEVLF